MGVISKRISKIALCLTGLCFIASAQTAQTPGTWKDVTPSPDAAAGYSGCLTILTDPVKQSNCWFGAAERGFWKSTDYGLTWKKVSTGTNGDKLDSGRPWYAASDMNPNRDPNTDPVIYTTMGYGAGCVWKSIDGGVNWTNVWNNNIYAPDGTTNISADVGGDIHEVVMPDKTNKDHVLATLHSYYGTGDNNGIFETVDGGTKWIVRKSATFNFQPHSDILFTWDKDTWMVTHGTGWPMAEVNRSTDAGATWGKSASTVGVNLGRASWIVGSTIWAGTDYVGGLYKSTDKGLTWKQLSTPNGNNFSWACATATTLYASGGQGSPKIFHAPLSNDATLVDGGNPSGMTGNGACPPGVLFDGMNYIIIAAQAASGIWRYVEPASTTSIAPVSKLAASSRIANNSPRILTISGSSASLHNMANTGSAIHNLQGREIRGALKPGVGVYIMK